MLTTEKYQKIGFEVNGDCVIFTVTLLISEIVMTRCVPCLISDSGKIRLPGGNFQRGSVWRLRRGWLWLATLIRNGQTLNSESD